MSTYYIYVGGKKPVLNKMEKRYIDVVEMAKILRKELKKEFPSTKFSVTTSKYSGGCSINCNYIDGPGHDKVDSIVQKYNGKGFDGMIDMSFYYDLCLLKDGTLQVYKSEGTENSNGYNRSFDNLPEGAVPVDTSHPYAFTSRDISSEIEIKAAKDIAKIRGIEFKDMYDTPFKDDDRSYRNWYNIMRSFLYDLDLRNFTGVRSTDCECGSWEDFYEVC